MHGLGSPLALYFKFVCQKPRKSPWDECIPRELKPVWFLQFGAQIPRYFLSCSAVPENPKSTDRAAKQVQPGWTWLESRCALYTVHNNIHDSFLSGFTHSNSFILFEPTLILSFYQLGFSYHTCLSCLYGYWITSFIILSSLILGKAYSKRSSNFLICFLCCFSSKLAILSFAFKLSFLFLLLKI